MRVHSSMASIYLFEADCCITSPRYVATHLFLCIFHTSYLSMAVTKLDQSAISPIAEGSNYCMPWLDDKRQWTSHGHMHYNMQWLFIALYPLQRMVFIIRTLLQHSSRITQERPAYCCMPSFCPSEFFGSRQPRWFRHAWLGINLGPSPFHAQKCIWYATLCLH